MIPRYNLWIEVDGQVVLSKWRIELLEAVRASGSITAAAELMHVPYRRAWERIHEMEERLGETLIITEVGGSEGGGAYLTEAAEEYIRRFQEFQSGLGEELRERFEKAFESEV
jgi:molybdate transport system regulatory protein